VDRPCSLRWLSRELGPAARTLRQVAERADDFYKPFEFTKGTKVRWIDRPIGELKAIQSLIKDRFLSRFPFPGPFHGGVKGRSPYTNAKQHLNKPCVVSLDLADFFPSVTNAMVYKVWRDVFKFGPPVASLLTKLTTHQGHLPQGASTSGFLANLVLLPAGAELVGIASAKDCTLTFYVDDISISGARAREVISPLIGLLSARGLRIRRDKTQVAGRNTAQRVNGLNVNGRLASVPLPRRDKVRELIHERNLRQAFGEDVGKIDRSLTGKIAHVRQTNPGHADRLDRLRMKRRVHGS
jgi:hypothetical protein